MSKILVVDDDRDILQLVKTILTMNNFVVEALSRWEEINYAVISFKPDLILLDVSLNGADGRDICKNMRQSKETEFTPVILFSANAEMGNFIQDCHAQAFIAKPFELTNLVQTIISYAN
ncbi:MAG: response regulator [Ginsengibacter sp.]|jgi:DNA-binding response OmpR family regulator